LRALYWLLMLLGLWLALPSSSFAQRVYKLSVQVESAPLGPPRKKQDSLVLYRLCANDLTLNLLDGKSPLDGSVLHLMMEGGLVQRLSVSPNHFRVMPTEPQGRIRVYAILDGNKHFIQDLPFRALQPPLPTFDLRLVQATSPTDTLLRDDSQLELSLRMPESFALICPEDYRYALAQVKVYLYFDSLAPKPLKLYSFPALKPGQLAATFPLLDAQLIEAARITRSPLIIQIEGLERLAFTGDIHFLPAPAGQPFFRRSFFLAEY
jgi:hypothetical protein